MHSLSGEPVRFPLTAFRPSYERPQFTHRRAKATAASAWRLAHDAFSSVSSQDAQAMKLAVASSPGVSQPEAGRTCDLPAFRLAP